MVAGTLSPGNRNNNLRMDEEHVGDDGVDFGGDMGIDGGFDSDMGMGDMGSPNMGGAVVDEESAMRYLNSKGTDKKSSGGGMGKPVPKARGARP